MKESHAIKKQRLDGGVGRDVSKMAYALEQCGECSPFADQMELERDLEQVGTVVRLNRFQVFVFARVRR